MKISDYPLAEGINPDDLLLLDGENGTKSIKASSLDKRRIANPEMLDAWYDVYDEIEIPYQLRRTIYRGKNLGSVFTDEQKANIADRKFRGFFIGDYWEKDGNKYRIADINYWLWTGDEVCSTPHLVIVPDKGVGDPKPMNDTNMTAGGYIGSKLYTSYMGTATNIISSIFESEDRMLHRELFVNAVTNGYPSGGTWVGVATCLMNEPMVYGSYQLTPGSTGTVSPYRYTIDKTQLALFQLHPEFICINRESYWLRDVVTATQFAYVSSIGISASQGASNVLPIRPVFGIIG